MKVNTLLVVVLYMFHVPTHVVSVFITYFQFELEQCDFEAREDLSTVKYF